jgi:effector-binding domain-containing protein
MTLDQIPIGRFSTLTRLTQKALRYYDTKGLLTPQAKNTITGYRYYTGDQIKNGIQIKYLTTLGFSIEEIQNYLKAEAAGDDSKISQLLETRYKRAKSELVKIQRVLSLLEGNHKELMKETMSEPIVKTEPKVRIISKRAKGISSEVFGRLMGELFGFINTPENRANFVKIVGPPMAIYYDTKYSEDEGEFDVAFPITGKITVDSDEFEVKNLPERKVVSLVHKGSYETIGLAYKTLYEHIQEKGYEMIGPMMDVYLSDPEKVEPDEILTEIQAPIK